MNGPENPMNMLEELSYKGVISWDEVFDVWRKNEASQPGWVEVATKVKGWPDWESWRRYMAAEVGAEEREWKLYEFTDPMIQIPEMLVGPFQSWQNQLPEEKRLQTTFSDFIAERLDWARGHGRIQDMIQHFPSSTQFTGLYLEDQDRLLCFEGSHRAAAVALAARDGMAIDFGEQVPLIAVASISGDSSELLLKALETGSDNPERKQE
ncbi:hypothetical protein KC725_00275 [Candidatus Peregrinibacteria bacterium]|nr:hypothetical protein [Candidatus Peregrinibacteria bacterium]